MLGYKNTIRIRCWVTGQIPENCRRTTRKAWWSAVNLPKNDDDQQEICQEAMVVCRKYAKNHEGLQEIWQKTMMVCRKSAKKPWLSAENMPKTMRVCRKSAQKPWWSAGNLQKNHDDLQEIWQKALIVCRNVSKIDLFQNEKVWKCNPSFRPALHFPVNFTKYIYILFQSSGKRYVVATNNELQNSLQT